MTTRSFSESVKLFIRYSLRLRRVEYRLAEVPIFFIPALLVQGDTSILSTGRFWEGLVIFLFMFAFGDLVNCLADRDLDSVYKPYLTEAVYGLGIRGVKAQIWFSFLGGMLLTVHLAAMSGSWIFVPLSLAGFAVAYAYSAEPFRLKGRGLWQLGFYWFGLFVGPMIFAAMLVEQQITYAVLGIIVSYGLVQTGVILLNTAEDLPEDRASNVRTVVVDVGLDAALMIASVCVGVGGIALVVSFSETLPQSASMLYPTAALFLLGAVLVATTFVVLRLRARVKGRPESDAMIAVRATGKLTPIFITSTAISSLLAAFAVVTH